MADRSKPPPPFAGGTTFTYSLSRIDGDRDRPLVSSGGESFPDALARLFGDASYYLLVCGYRVRCDGVQEECKTCCGQGTIPYGRFKVKRKQCKDCRTTPTREVVGAFEVPLSCNVNQDACVQLHGITSSSEPPLVEETPGERDG